MIDLDFKKFKGYHGLNGSTRAIIYIYTLAFYGLAWKLFNTQYFLPVATAVALLVLFYHRRYSVRELLPGVGILSVILILSNFHHQSNLPRVMWIKGYNQDYRIAVVEGWKWIRVKEGEEVEIGDLISKEGEVLVKGKGISVALDRLRYKLYRELEEAVNYPVSAVAGACTLGIRFELPPSLKGYFSLSGLYHFLAISGLHVGIVVGAVAGLLKLLRVPRPLTSACLVMLPLMPLTGLPPSALRAYLLMFLIALGIEEFRKITPLYTLGVVMLLTVIFGKFNLSAALSFSAVGGILLSIEGEGDKWEKSLKVAVAPLLFTLPIVLYLFGTVNLMSWLTTILVGFIFTPFLISTFLTEVTLYKVGPINEITQLLGELFIRATQISFNYTKWTIVHSEIPLYLAAITYLACLLLYLTGKVRFILIPPALLLVYGLFNQTVITGKELHLKGWKLNSFRFISTTGQRYRECRIYGTYVMPATRKLLFRNRLIDERLKRFKTFWKGKGSDQEEKLK